MSGRNNKPKYKPKPFESRGETYKDGNGKVRKDSSANLFESMLTSEAFQSLTSRQKVLYVYCKSQYYGKRKPGRDYPDIKELQGDDMFYFNLRLAITYGLYPESSSSNFYSDMGVLIDRGFIERVVSGAAHRSKSIYRFSDGWQKWSG